MAAGATAETMLRSVLAGSLVMQEFEVERRPYHKNCGCALHNLKGICSSACSRARNLSFPKKNNRRNIDCSLSMAANPQFSSRSYPVVGTSIKSMESKATTGVSFMACEK